MVLRLLLACALFLLGARATRAQGAAGVTLSGRVQDADTRAPLPYLTVQLLTGPDDAFLTGRLTNAAGAFSFTGLAKGSYVVLVRSIGYRPIRERVRIGELSPFLDLGVLLLTREATTLQDVVVSATPDAVSPTLERKTFTVADNISQSGGSVLQAMSMVPGVTRGDDGKLLLRGSDKVIVLIDGKQTALTGFGSQAGLENLPASAIERIEVIAAPGARFDANASAGVINLVLKKEDRRGLNGRVGLMGGAGALVERRASLPTVRPPYRATPKVNPSLAVNYRRGATNTFLQADWLHAPTLNKNEFATRRYDDGTAIVQQVQRNRRTDYGTLTGGVDHAFDGQNSLVLSGLFNREKIIDHGDNPYFDGDLGRRVRFWQFLEDEVKYTAYGSGVFTHRFPAPGHSLAVTGLYSFHREDEKYFFTNTVPSGVGTDAFKLLSDEHVMDLSVDYVRPLRQGRVEAGLKGRHRSIPVDMQFRPGALSVIDTGAGGWATYRETIPALYATYVYEGARVEVEGGLRLEQVRVAYDVNPTHNTYRSDGYRYAQPFPNVRLAWRVDDAHKITLFVNRRVDRPNEVDIRIFPKYDEPELIKVGNPALRPQFATSAELGYKGTWSRGSLYAAGFHRIVDGTITRIATQAPGSVLLYNVFQNAGRSWSTGMELAWQQTFSPRVTLTTNASAFQRTIAAFEGINRYPVPVRYAEPRQRLVSGTVKGSLALQLRRPSQLQLAGTYLAPDLVPQGRIGSRFALDLGAKQSVQGGQGEITLNATDLFGTNQIRRTIRGTAFRLVSTDYLETQVVRLGYTRKF